MTDRNYKHFYTQALAGHAGNYHFAAHSHHLWPDVSKLGHDEAWRDACLSSDKKWGKIFEEVMPETKKLIADILSLKHPERIVFAPNTHELLIRVISLFDNKEIFKVLTSNSEFHSFKRQMMRLEEDPRVQVTRQDSTDIFTKRTEWVDEFVRKIQATEYDMIFLSTVFFDSGFAFTQAEIEKIVNAKNDKTIFVLDGYHSFCALPYNLSKLEGKIFFLGGGYKYAQSGEGVCFMVTPPGKWRPSNTGWFAEFNDLHKAPGEKVGYADDANAFWGGTFDPTGIYRFRSIWSFFKYEGISIDLIHAYVSLHQNMALNNGLHTDQLMIDPINLLSWHGHFLTYGHDDEAEAILLSQKLTEKHILHDRRGKRVRLGFGLYQSNDDIQYLLQNTPFKI